MEGWGGTDGWVEGDTETKRLTELITGRCRDGRMEGETMMERQRPSDGMREGGDADADGEMDGVREGDTEIKRLVEGGGDRRLETDERWTESGRGKL